MHNKRSKLNQPLHIVGHTLSPFNCAHFSHSILKSSWQTTSLLPAFCWNPIGSLVLHTWTTNHTKISDFVSLSLNLNYWVYDYFTFKLWETTPPAPFFKDVLGQIHMNGWSCVIASQNGGLTSYIFSFRLKVLQ